MFERVNERDEARLVRPGNLTNGFRVGIDLNIVRRRIGKRRREPLMPRRAEQHQPHPRRNLLKSVEQPIVIGLELLQARFAVERTRHAIADEHDRGLRLFKLFDQLIPTFVRWLMARLQQRKSKARIARRCVRAPAEIAEREVAIRKPRREHQLNPAKLLLAFDEGVAEEDHAVALAQLERRGFVRRPRVGAEDEQEA